MKKLTSLALSLLFGAVIGFTQATSGTPETEVKPTGTKVTPPQHKGGRIAVADGPRKPLESKDVGKGKQYSQRGSKSGTAPHPKSSTQPSSPTKQN